MADLSVKLGDLELKNPVMIAAGPWTRDPACIQRYVDAGAGAVITESITMDADQAPRPYLYRNGDQIFNTKLHSTLYLEQWEELASGMDMRDCKLICSIWGSTVTEVRYLSNYVQRLGADAVELSLYAPIGSRNQGMCTSPEHIADVIRETMDAVDIPVMVKLPYEVSFFPEVLQAIYDAGVKTVSSIDALRGISGVDIETATPNMPTYGGYSGQAIRPVSLATTAMLRQYTPFYICGCGGIQNAENAIEQMMLGASAFQFASALFNGGETLVRNTLNHLQNWLDQHHYKSVEDIIGLALPRMSAFEAIPIRPIHAIFEEKCDRKECDLCRQGCIYQAIECVKGKGYRILDDRCEGCGHCMSICPENKIRLGGIPPVSYKKR